MTLYESFIVVVVGGACIFALIKYFVSHLSNTLPPASPGKHGNTGRSRQSLWPFSTGRLRALDTRSKKSQVI